MRISDWSSDVCSSDLIDIDHGLRHAPDAKLVVVTPGQQAPLGPTLSLERRLRLLDWAAGSGVRGIEADSLSEQTDRQSVGAGKSLAVRVDLGGSRLIKKPKTHTKQLSLKHHQKTNQKY